MRGHEPLIAMRRSGVRPGCVFIDVGIPGDLWREWPDHSPGRAIVSVEAGDMLSGLDLRWVVGMTVMVEGHPASRVEAIRDRCIAEKALRVVSTVVRDGMPHTTDTEGHMGDKP